MFESHIPSYRYKTKNKVVTSCHELFGLPSCQKNKQRSDKIRIKKSNSDTNEKNVQL